MIKLFFKNPHRRLFWGGNWKAQRGLMLTHGICAVDREKEADIVLITSDGWKGGTDTGGGYDFPNVKSVAEKIGKPVIVTERSDTAKTWYRDNTRVAKNIIAIFKNRTTRNMEEENRLNPQDKSRAWAAPELRDGKSLPIIPPEIYNKIYPVVWDWHSSHLMKTCQYHAVREPTPLEKRKIDVFCVSKDRPTQKHGQLRKKAKKYISGWGHETETTSLRPHIYNSKFRDSKICVGCWGFGEWVHMDGYAFYNKTILIKPECDYIYQWPDLYRSNETYIACAPDYSNLKDILNEVYSDCNSYADMLDNNRKMVLEATEEESLKIFCETIKKVYE